MGEEHRTYHWGADLTPNQRRVPVAKAAELLGISEGAVRMRVKRGTLPSTREGGRLYVLLDTEPTPEPERPHDRTHDRTSELIATLREQLEAERRANEENRRIIAALTQRIPEIEAPPEPRESPESPAPSETPTEGSGGPQSASERRWWEFWR
jgi:hypothetical protein